VIEEGEGRRFTRRSFACSELAGERNRLSVQEAPVRWSEGETFSIASTEIPRGSDKGFNGSGKKRRRPPVLLAVAGCKGDGSDDCLRGCAGETVSASDGF
jgi:hypothetical protein